MFLYDSNILRLGTVFKNGENSILNLEGTNRRFSFVIVQTQYENVDKRSRVKVSCRLTFYKDLKLVIRQQLLSNDPFLFSIVFHGKSVLSIRFLRVSTYILGVIIQMFFGLGLRKKSSFVSN